MDYLNNKSLNMIIKAQSTAVMNVFSKRNIPYREIYFNKNDEEELGSIFTFFVLETILLARMMNINPFDQPAVEDVKIITKKILSR
jgi:glucose-6-phosphate isomerase